MGGEIVLTPPPGEWPAPYDVRATAVDPTSGRTLWQYGPFDPGGVIFSELGGALIYQDSASTTTSPTLARVDPSTGQNLWRLLVHPVSETAAGGGLISLESAGYQKGPYSVVRRDLATGAANWQAPAPITGPGGSDIRLLTVRGPAGPLVVLLAGTALTAYNATDGTVAWRLSIPSSALVDGIAAVDGGLVLQISGDQYAVQH